MAVVLVGGLLFGGAATIPLSEENQFFVAMVGIVASIVIARLKRDDGVLILKLLSLFVSLRYFVWRFTETIEITSVPQAVMTGLLLFAEVFAGLMLVLSYFQTLHALNRKPVPLPADTEAWPSVDVYVPTYNEDLSIVRKSVLGCLGMDWPRDRLNVYILDDGNREEFVEFARSCGAGYISRTDNRHAKAGNLNHAMSITKGDYVAIFDCDHIPVRAFLQATMGWLVADPTIGLVQTPHHFYSPDPFERNLSEGLSVPPEGNLFYGLLQPGNDFWNSAFFCGSCAVLRRKALDAIGGIATDTVTEDCHTALRMQRAGWSSAYLRIPLAAGLATERLILHIGQRARWARGMTQIFRLDNPLFGRGLTLAQRLCYLSGTISFLFAIPRLIFLLAPLAYLFFGDTLIAASPLAVSVYALPHFFHSVTTASRVNRQWRYSFFSELYDIALAPFLAPVTFMTLLFPRRGRFNVTDKGGLVTKDYTDFSAIWPQILVFLLLAVGVASGVWRILFGHEDTQTINALWTTALWGALNATLVCGAVLVGREARQIRHSFRLAATLPLTLRPERPVGTSWHTADSTVPGVTIDVSSGGCRVRVPSAAAASFSNGHAVRLAIVPDEPEVRAHVVHAREGEVNLRWSPETVREEAAVIRFVFGRADAWSGWDQYRPDSPARSGWLLLKCIIGVLRRRKLTEEVERDKRILRGEQRAITLMAERERRKKAVILSPTRLVTVAAGVLIAAAGVAQARPPAQPIATDASPTAEMGDLDALPLPDAEVGLPAQGRALPPGAVSQATPLSHFGMQKVLRIVPWSSVHGVTLPISSNQLVVEARLILSGTLSPRLIDAGGVITVRLNNQYVGTITATRKNPSFQSLALPIDPVLFSHRNTLTFSMDGGGLFGKGKGIAATVSSQIWADLQGSSVLAITTVPLPPDRKLNLLPAPLFDEDGKDPVIVPFVLPRQQRPAELKAAAIMAGWFGKLTDERGVSFPVSTRLPRSGNAVVIAPVSQLPSGVVLPASVQGPFVAELANPNDQNSTLLVVTGQNWRDVSGAARAIALMPESLSDSTWQAVSAPVMTAREPYDAPAYIPTDRAVRFGELVSDAMLTGHGYVPGTLSVPFRVSPDLYTWRDRPFIAHVKINGPLPSMIDVDHSHVDVSLNGLYLQSFSWRHPLAVPSWLSRYLPASSLYQRNMVRLPGYGVYAQNRLDFYFSGQPSPQQTVIAPAQDISVEIDPNSVLDLRRAYHFAILPNLALFANSAFPFTRLADLSETAICLPDSPDTATRTAFLDLMGTIGAYTWYPADKMTLLGESELATPEAAETLADKDVLALDVLSETHLPASLLDNAPYQLSGGRLLVQQHSFLDGLRYFFADIAGNTVVDPGTVKLEGALELKAGGAFVASRSPYARHRSLVLMLAGTPQGLEQLVQAMRDPVRQRAIQGDLAVVNGTRVVASRNGLTYTVGTLPTWVNIERLFQNHPWRIIIFAALAIFLISRSLKKIVVEQSTRRARTLQRAIHEATQSAAATESGEPPR